MDERHNPLADLRHAISGGLLRLHFQPVVDLLTGRMTGVEGLLRWEHPTGGLLYPDDFISAARHSDVMPAVTRWVVNAGCRAAAQWPHLLVGVNVSPTDLTRDEFVDEVEDALRRHCVRAHQLLLEVTEDAVVQDMPRAAATLERLQRIGVHAALDDFGTGYSSLFYLRELPIEYVKIDKVFVGGTDKTDEDAAIVDSVVRLARAVGVTAIGEGVERETQADYLRRAGCRFAQGFLFGAAAAPHAVDPWRTYEVASRATPARSTNAAPCVDSGTADRMRDLLRDGASLHTIAAALNLEGRRQVNGSRWKVGSVARALADLPSGLPDARA